MSSLIFRLFAILVILLLGSCKKEDPVSPSTGSISGTVTDASSGNGIAGVSITTQPASSSATTDNSGKYQIADASPGMYQLSAAKNGYKTATVSVSVVAGKTATADIALSPSVMIFVQGGTFQMGRTTGFPDEQPVHSVTVSSYFMDETEVTYEKWTSVRNWAIANGYSSNEIPVGRNGYNGTTNHPVTEVNWFDIIKWCNARSQMEGLTPVYYTNATQDTIYKTGQIDLVNGAEKTAANGYRLPTEAEWEFAARGGNATHGYEYSGSADIGDVAWFSANAGNNTHPVGGLAHNELGLYDMSGNVWEWVWDWYGPYPSTAQTNPQGPTSGTNRVFRGGSFVGNYGVICRVAYRNYYYSPTYRSYNGGFRCTRK